MASTIEVPVRHTGTPQAQQRCIAQLAVAVALLLAVTTGLIFLALTRGPAPASTGNQSGTPIVMPHPAPGPFGS